MTKIKRFMTAYDKKMIKDKDKMTKRDKRKSL